MKESASKAHQLTHQVTERYVMSPWAAGPLLGLVFGGAVVLINRHGSSEASLAKSGITGAIFFGVLMTVYLLWRRDHGDRQ